MEKRGFLWLCLVGLSILLAATLWQPTEGGPVIGIDLGTEVFKIAMIQGGKIDLVLNIQSGRKTPTNIGFTDRNERIFGEQARSALTKFPTTVYGGLQQLVGRSLKHPSVLHALNHYFYSVKEESNGRFSLVANNDVLYPPEDLLAMILQSARETASAASSAFIKDAIITIPIFFTESQRAALIDAAKLAGLNVLALTHDGTAVATQYALTRDINEEENVVFYDLGAAHLRATLVTFNRVPVEQSKTKNQTVPQLRVRSVVWDETLGGRDFDSRLADHFVSIVNKQFSSTPNFDIRSKPRALAKLKREAREVKVILSANQEVPIILESLFGEYDFKTLLTRKQFEEMCDDLFQRAILPLQRLLSDANLTQSEIHAVEIIGGGSRMPKIQEMLKKFFQRDHVDYHLNGDEAAVLGVTFRGAVLSPGFRVKTDVIVKDITQFPIHLTLSPIPVTVPNTIVDDSLTTSLENNLSEDSNLITNEDLNTTLFKKGNRIGSKRNISFKIDTNFTIDLSYESSIDLPSETPLGIKRYVITGVPNRFSSWGQQKNITGRPRINLTFILNNHGLVELTKAEATYSFFVPKQSPKNETSSTTTETETGKNTDSETNNKNAQTSAQEQNQDTEEGEEVKWVLKQQKVTLLVESFPTGFPLLNHTQFLGSQARLAALDQKDRERKETEEAKNSLESYIYSQRDKLYEDYFIFHSTEEERAQLSDQLDTVSNWLFEQEEDSSPAEYRKQLRQLKQLGDKIELRRSEAIKRPEALQELHSLISFTREFIRNASTIRNITDADIAEMDELLDSTARWLSEKEKEQQTKKPYEDPVIFSSDILARFKKIENFATRLVRKPLKKTPTPTPTPKPSSPPSDNSQASTDSPSPSPHFESETSQDQALKDEANTVKT